MITIYHISGVERIILCKLYIIQDAKGDWVKKTHPITLEFTVLMQVEALVKANSRAIPRMAGLL
jgi:hypothetical protein